MYFPNTDRAQMLLGSFLENLQDGITIGVTSGCFDILHPLHVQYLEKCKASCDMLIVGVDSDALMFATKGKYPVFSEQDRGTMVAALHVVDIAFTMESVDMLQGILEYLMEQTSRNTPVKLYKGLTSYYGEPVVQVPGVELVQVADVYPANSTTDLIKFIQNNYQKL